MGTNDEWPDLNEARPNVPPSPIPTLAPKTPTVSAPGLYLGLYRCDDVYTDQYGIPLPLPPNNALENRYAEPSNEQYAFTIRHSFNNALISQAGFLVHIGVRSPYFITVAKQVMKAASSISWSTIPVMLELDLLLGFLPKFEEFRDRLGRESTGDRDDSLILEHVSFFIKLMHAEYSQRLGEFRSLSSQGLITYDLLWGLFIPGTIVLMQEHIFNLPTAHRVLMIGDNYFDPHTSTVEVTCESLHRAENLMGLITQTFMIKSFGGVKKITELEVYPLEYHPRAEDTARNLLSRGRKWLQFHGIQHKLYDGVAVKSLFTSKGQTNVKYETKSRIIIDQDRFTVNTNSIWGSVERTVTGEKLSLTSNAYDPSIQPPDDVLMLSDPYAYGFLLANKEWVYFNLNCIYDIHWDKLAFDHLAIPAPQKELILSLVESHTRHGSVAIDDFIEGKGLGLIISLSGPPGVGKTLTAEVTSEHTERPLYIVSADEVGADAGTLELNLPKIFTYASAWNAVLLLDEAEVFLEQRSATDLGRNAIVAVLLRQLEYFPGIIFLTTNREVVFDEALSSRIHISIHYPGLSVDARRRVWESFLARANRTGWPEPTLRKLSAVELNGRQIKNAVNTANILAKQADEELGMEHILTVLDINKKNALDASQRLAEKREAQMDRALEGIIVMTSTMLVALLLYDPLSTAWRLGA